MTPFTVLHIPHSSVAIPADIRPDLLVSDDELQLELLRMTDRYTDELFSLPADDATAVVFPVSRIVLDPERFADDAQEVMAARGMGVIYTRTADGRVLREPPTAAQREALLDRFYVPHHMKLTAAVNAALNRHRYCLVIDCHSYPSAPLPCDLDQAPERPDICIGTDAFHTPPWLRKMAVQGFAAQGFTVEVDRPYAGALVPAAHYQKRREVIAVMIEINRKLYMDEASGNKLPGFSEVAAAVQRTVTDILTAMREAADLTSQPPSTHRTALT